MEDTVIQLHSQGPKIEYYFEIRNGLLLPPVGGRGMRRQYTGLEIELDCSKCHQIKPIARFHLHATSARGWQYWCRECTQEYRTARGRPKISPAIQRKWRLWSRYRITSEFYTSLYESQSGRCKICGVAKKSWAFHDVKTRKDYLVVDHEHSSGVVRGLLCVNCNCALGHFKDNPANLAQALTYLEAASGEI